MEYRTLGRTGKQVSILSLGCMRLPADDEQGAKVVSRAIDLGINYFETSEGYCEGRSEIMVGMGVKGRRGQVIISTKSCVRPDTTGEATRRKLEDSLKRLDTDRVDFYQAWDFKWDDFEALTARRGPLEVLEKARDEGIIGHIGITSHETNENLMALVNTGRFESITLSYSLLHCTVEPVIEAAHQRGMGVVCMRPLAGGLLATPSDILLDLLPDRHRGTTDAALKFVLSNPGVTTAASGMTSVAEVEENVAALEDFRPLRADERARAVKTVGEYRALGERFCTGCNYCMPCPEGVKIPRLFRVRNYYKIFGLTDWAVGAYGRMDPAGLPDACTECGECETKCPNKIPIINQLKEVAAMFKEMQS